MRRRILLATAGAVLIGAAVYAQSPPGSPSGAPNATAAATPMPAAALLGPSAAPTAPPAPAAGAELPIQYTRLVVFSIPFDPPPPALRAMEVQLYYSADQGRNWSLFGKSPPSAGQFNFQAPRDGEYWFFVRTLDDRGQLHPAAIGNPEMRVVVDTVPPQLQLAVERGTAGELIGRWRVEDTLLKVDGLSLSCGTGTPDATWQSLAVGSLTADSSGQVGLGEATWWVNSPVTGDLIVRAEVVDRAGNTLVVQEQVRPAGTSTLPAGANPMPSSAPPRVWAPDEVTTAGPSANSASPAAAPVAAPAEATPPAGPALQASPAPTPSPVEPLIAQQFSPTAPALGPPSNASLELPPPTGAPTPTMPTVLSDDPPAMVLSEIPAGIVPRFVNALRFELHCDLTEVAGSGLKALELFGTRDGGRTWLSFGQTPDTRAPLVMTVNSEGVYGFRVRPHATSGPVGQAPQTGDAPDIWVVVDTTQPTARLTRVDFGQGLQTNEVAIGWEAADTRLAERPITLDYAGQTSGPWTAIAAGLPNVGTFRWRTDARLPQQVYLRLTVRDAAGNVAAVQTPEPITLPRANPAGRIVEVRAMPAR